MDICLRGESNQTVSGKNVKAAKKGVKANNPEILKFKNGPGKFKNISKKFNKARGLIYLGRIPHGFYEDEMTAYFSQFGRVISAVIPRSKKSGRSKGYGFVEFEDEEVAKIAAETMNNYLMYNKIIKCRYIPPEERKKSAFMRRASIVTCPRVLNRIETARKKRESLSKLNQTAYQEKTQKKLTEFKQFFEERGIKFNFMVDVGNSRGINNSNDSEKDDIKDSNNTDNEMEDQFGVLEIDTSDAEIHFRIPPQVKKIIKKSNNTPIALDNSSQVQTKPIIKKSKRSSAKEAEKKIRAKKITKTVAKTLKEKNKVRGKTLKKVSNTEKSKPLRKKGQILKGQILNQKNLRSRQVDNTKVLIKKKNNMEEKYPRSINRKLTGEKIKMTQ